jgi:hypothetical protein
VATYLPTANLSPLYNFVQYTSGGSGITNLQTALNALPGVTSGSVQVFADATTGQTSNALVVFNDQQVFSVPSTNYVGYNQGTWAQYTAAKMAGGGTSVFTAYP